MAFGMKKESKEEKAARLRKELDELSKTDKDAAVIVDALVSEMKNEQKGAAEPGPSFVEDLERFAGVFPELGPSAHAHYERVLLVAILEELRALREDLRGKR